MGTKKNLRNKVDIFIPYYMKNNGIYSNKTYIALPRNVNELILIKVFSANLFQSRKLNSVQTTYISFCKRLIKIKHVQQNHQHN